MWGVVSRYHGFKFHYISYCTIRICSSDIYHPTVIVDSYAIVGPQLYGAGWGVILKNQCISYQTCANSRAYVRYTFNELQHMQLGPCPNCAIPSGHPPRTQPSICMSTEKYRYSYDDLGEHTHTNKQRHVSAPITVHRERKTSSASCHAHQTLKN